MEQPISAWADDNSVMLTEIYIEALLVDAELADQVWEAWNAKKLNDGAACIAWMYIGFIRIRSPFVT